MSGAELTFVPPNEVDGVKCVYYRKEDVETEMARWKMALIVYVLGSKPPFHVMRNFFERKWGKFGGLKVFRLKTRVYVVKCNVASIVQYVSLWEQNDAYRSVYRFSQCIV
ncbi:hypothetical protein LguiB_026636 [Lonicera macranthoides]